MLWELPHEAMIYAPELRFVNSRMTPRSAPTLCFWELPNDTRGLLPNAALAREAPEWCFWELLMTPGTLPTFALGVSEWRQVAAPELRFEIFPNCTNGLSRMTLCELPNDARGALPNWALGLTEWRQRGSRTVL